MDKQGSTRPAGADIRETGDLAFAAYAHMRGLRVLRAREWRGRGSAVEYAFTFADPPTATAPAGIWGELQIEFTNSEAAAFDAALRRLKRLCKQNGDG